MAFAPQEELNKETPVLRLRPTAKRFIPFILPVSPSFPDFFHKKGLGNYAVTASILVMLKEDLSCANALHFCHHVIYKRILSGYYDLLAFNGSFHGGELFGFYGGQFVRQNVELLVAFPSLSEAARLRGELANLAVVCLDNLRETGVRCGSFYILPPVAKQLQQFFGFCGGCLGIRNLPFRGSAAFGQNMQSPRAEPYTTNKTSANAWYARDYKFYGCHILAFCFICCGNIVGWFIGYMIGDKYFAPYTPCLACAAGNEK